MSNILNNVITNANTTLAVDRGGIRIRGANFTGPVDISNNIISGSLNGIAVANSDNIAGKTITVNDNNLSGNVASVYHGGTGLLNAECNWHGSKVFNTILAQLGGSGASNIDFVSYLTSNTDGDGAMGFQPSGACDGSPVVISSATPDYIICGEATGSIEVIWAGGTTTFTVSWTGLAGSGSTQLLDGSPRNITGLAPGTYDVTVTDIYGTYATITGVEVKSLPVTLTHLGSPTYYATISAAIVAAVDSDEIDVCAGTYNESLNINKQLNLRGAQADNCASTRTGAESIINCPTGNGIYASNVTINGFTIQGQTIGNAAPGWGYAVYMAPPNTGTQLLNNIIRNNIVGSSLSNAGPSPFTGFN